MERDEDKQYSEAQVNKAKLEIDQALLRKSSDYLDKFHESLSYSRNGYMNPSTPKRKAYYDKLIDYLLEKRAELNL